jgi:hypothetical protein
MAPVILKFENDGIWQSEPPTAFLSYLASMSHKGANFSPIFIPFASRLRWRLSSEW